MKKTIYFTSLLLITISTIKSQTIERIGLKGPINFNKTEFNLAWSEKPNDNYYIQEYLPKNETVEKFNELITVNLFVLDVSVENAIHQKVSELTKRKETDKVCNFSVINSPDGEESILDCLLSSNKNDELDIVEFIIYRYKQIELDNHKKALLVYSYSKRSYGNKITKFLQNLATERENLLNVMISTKIPETKIKE
ncbi:hypothetical protein [Flavobacterium aestivum]|uniref:hypothetical protein n=1 Tax=Flavobacterium aestivum TaxID=3003257 RepID=UPI002285B833|nr:hypothetical protein [Flavobacterium aestivum]